MDHLTLRKLFSDFWEKRDHKHLPEAPLVLKEDPTTLFNSSGMQQLVPNLLGEPHPLGKRLYNIQPSVRTGDIDEVGNNRHLTLFEMMGNWSLGDYFKQEQLPWFYEFLTKNLSLDPRRLYITVFEGNNEVPRDDESATIWKKLGIPETRIVFYGADKNWWSRSGPPEKMPAGEVGGPDSEVFFDFGEELKIHESSPFSNQKCHPNCDCGRFTEIGNSVFIQYRKSEKGTLEELAQKNVDFGGGLERMLTAIQNIPDIFMTDVFTPVLKTIEDKTGVSYQEEKHKPTLRVIADHLKAATFLIADGVQPSNKEHGYVLRRLLRRCALRFHTITGTFRFEGLDDIASSILETYDGVASIKKDQKNLVTSTINEEMKKFGSSLDRGLKEIKNLKQIDGKVAFDLYQSYGFPLEITEDILKEKGVEINKQQFEDEFNKHKELSRTASAGKFKGGLADHSDQVIKYHTATHLIHQALFDVLGEVRQEGSNITVERLRFDFSSAKKPSKEDIQKVEEIANKKVKEAINVEHKIIPREEAFKIGARAFFKEKYPDKVKIYFVGDYSKEFCGGPHVQNTDEIGKISIFKFESIGSNMYRLYAK